MTDVARTSTTERAEPTDEHPRAPTGHLLDRFPYVRAGTGERTLAVLPGFGDAMFDGTYPPGTNWLLWGYFRRFVDDYTVYVLSRPRHLPEGRPSPGWPTTTRRHSTPSPARRTCSASRWVG